MDELKIFRIVTRTGAILLAVFALSNSLMIPVEVLSLWHHQHSFNSVLIQSYAAYDQYWARYSLLEICQHVLIAASEVMVGLWLYRGGPALQRFML